MLATNIHILKTDLSDLSGVKEIQSFLNQHPSVIRWNVDLEDVDNVLKAETLPNFSETDFIEALRIQGVRCAALPD